MSTYTEEEAKTKWCPFVRFVRLNDAIYSSRGPIIEPGSENGGALNCTASACMAWRWDKFERETLRFYKDDPRRKTTYVQAGTLRIVDGQQWRYEHTDCDDKGEFELLHRALSEASDKRVGRCGLAGDA